MLGLFRRQKQWFKWILLLGIIALGVTTVFLFVRTPTGVTGGLGTQEVASVAGERIRVSEFRRQYQQVYELYRQVYNLDQQNQQLIDQLGLPRQALNQLITEYAIWHEGQNLGLTVTDEELIEEIRNFPAFQQDGQFVGVEQYTQVLRANNFVPAEFEQAVRRDIMRRKFRNVLTDGIEATTDEAWENYVDQNQKVKLRYVMFDLGGAQASEVDEEQLKAYYEENKERYRVNEQRKLKYVRVATDPLSVTVTEEQVQEELDNIPVEEKVRARHILISSRDGDPDEEANRQKALKLLDQLKAGADFARLAEEHSEDPGSAAKGGDLGFFTRGQMVPEFEQVAFSLTPNELHPEVVKTPFGFHIIQTLAKTAANREAMRPEAEFKAKTKEAGRQAKAKAEKVSSLVGAGSTLEEAAAAESVEVRETGFFAALDPVPGLAVEQEFKNRVFAQPVGTVLDPYVGAGGVIVARIDDVKASAIPPLADVRDRVVKDFTEEKRDTLTRERADDFFQRVKQAESFQDLARDESLQVVTTDFFGRDVQNIDDNLLFSEEIKKRAFSYPVGKASSPVRVRQKYIVFQVAERSEVSREVFEESRAELVRTLTEQKRNDFFSSYVQNVVNRLQQQEQIAINSDLLEQIT